MVIFNARLRFPLHCLQALLALAVIALTIPQFFVPKSQLQGQAAKTGLGMGAKSLVFIAYQVLTEHVRSLRRWASLKAYTILNALEVMFWAAVAFFTIQANVQKCIALSCSLGWAVVVIAIVISIIALYAAILPYRANKECKRMADSLEMSTDR